MCLPRIEVVCEIRVQREGGGDRQVESIRPVFVALEALLSIRVCSHGCIRMHARTRTRTRAHTLTLTRAREQWQHWWKSCWILRRRPWMTSQRASSSSALVPPLACMSYEEEDTCMSPSSSSVLVLPLAPHPPPSPLHRALSGAGSARCV